MREHGCPSIGGRGEHLIHALVIQPIAVHGRKQADSAKLLLPERACEPGTDLAGGRVEHEESDESRRVPADGRRDRILVAGNARDNR